MTPLINEADEQALLEKALAAARDTKFLRVGAGTRHQTAQVFAALFPGQQAILIADPNTQAAAGEDVASGFRASGLTPESFLFDSNIYAEYSFVEQLEQRLRATGAIPIAVGSGTINDLTKLVAHHLGRRYLSVATAASVDGYTAYGASITYKGSKQTFDCPAPLGVLADLEVVAHAPAGMNASGYADLLAKNVAGADWIVADALGVEAIDQPVWDTVQKLLPAWVGAPAAVAAHDPAALGSLVNGLMMSGFAMQAMCSSRPASGADHQFSHLWDMQHHTHHGQAPSHGFKVGIGTLASLALYDYLLRQDLSQLDVERAVAAWPARSAVTAQIAALFGTGELADKAHEEMGAKYIDAEALRAQLIRLRAAWGEMRRRLSEHLIPFRAVRRMLAEAGCPSDPSQIGITRERLRLSYRQAYYIRRRFTVLDLAGRIGCLDAALEEIFGPGGLWTDQESAA